MPPRRPSPLLRCFAYYRGQPGMLAGVLALSLAVNLSLPLHQDLIRRALADIESGSAVRRLADGSLDAGLAWHWAILLVALNLGRGLLQYLGSVLGSVLGQRLLHDLRDRVLVQVQRLDLAYHLAHGAGEIITRTTRDSDKVRDAVTSGWRQLLELGLMMLATIGLLAWYDVRLAAVPAGLVAVALLMIVRQSERLVQLDRVAGDAYDRVTQELAEGVGGVRVIKAFALEPSRIAGFAAHVAGFAEQSRRALVYTVSRLPLPQLVVSLGHVWILWYGAVLVERGELGRPHLVAALMAVMGVVFRIEGIGRIMKLFAEARASAARIVDLLDARPEVDDGDQSPPPGPLGLYCAGVRVCAPGGAAGPPVLEGLDLAIAPGEVVALVGATGSGKSTFASLLPRLRDPDGGTLRVGRDAGGAIDLRRLRLGELRRRVQVVSQESFLFSDTVAANLRMARPEASDAELVAALEMAAAGDVLAGLPLGLESRIGERGVTLSGGQRQRLCLARAFLARPDLLCADDATSALDAVTERRILDNLRAAMRGTTVLLIAGKLSTILLADRVLLLHQGRIAAHGPHADLARDSALYRELLGLDGADAAQAEAR